LLGLRLHQRDTGEYQRECQSYFVQHDPSPCVEATCGSCPTRSRNAPIIPVSEFDGTLRASSLRVSSRLHHSRRRYRPERIHCTSPVNGIAIAWGGGCPKWAEILLVSRMLLHPRSWFKNLGLDKVLGNVLTLSIGRRHHGHVGRGSGRDDRANDAIAVF
jgi:hypothetical protein